MTATTMNIGKVRFSYVHVWEPDSIDGGDGKYSVSLIIPKSDKALVAKIQACIENAYKQGVGKFGGKLPTIWKNPLRDGDAERGEDEAYKGCYFINASSQRKPGVYKLPKPVRLITDQEEFYSGCYGFANVGFFAFNTNGNKGVACGLNHVLKTADGDYLGGRMSGEAAFNDADIPDTYDDFPGDDL